MDYINLKSHRGVVNLLADYILNKLITDVTIEATIEVTNCGKFFLVNGLTNSKKILSLHIIKEDFYKEYESLLKDLGYEQINVVDTITYDVELATKDEQSFNFYHTKRPIFSKEVIDFTSETTDLSYQSFSNLGFIELDYSEEKTTDLEQFKYSPINITSEFPHGYSWEMGRGNLYYSEYICNQLFNVIRVKELLFKFSTLKDKNDDFKIRVISDSIYSEKTIVSMILDNFNFNITSLKENMSGYNLLNDILNPLGDKPWLVKDKTKGLIIF
tara:strand:- start:14749 stop:15564 length:816 start_codon:yes stop_codon:yes gene_type:complete